MSDDNLINEIVSEVEGNLYIDQFNEAFIAVEDYGHQVINLDSNDFQNWLSGYCYENNGKSISDPKASQITKILKYKATKCTTNPLAVRVCLNHSNIYYDLGTEKYVEINGDGWNLVDTKYKILFRKLKHQMIQVLPEKGGNIDDLINLINIKDEKHALLLKVYLVAAFIPNFPHPVMNVHGAQGSAKSSLCKLIKSLVDPSSLETHSYREKDTNGLIQTASHHWLLVLDNLSYLADDVSDTISRICTGGGLSKRMHFRNDDDFIYNFMHLIVLNGITQIIYKPDLLDRSLMIELNRIDETNRITESELWKKFNEIKPKILGSIFDTVSKALKIYPEITLKSLPRMADFVMWGCAIAEALGNDRSEFLTAYSSNIQAQTDAALEANPVVMAIANFMEGREDFEGTPGTLYTLLKDVANKLSIVDAPGWPKAANAMSRYIPMYKPVLRTLGYEMIHSKGTARKIIIRKIDIDDTNNKPSVPLVPDFMRARDDKDGKDDIIINE